MATVFPGALDAPINPLATDPLTAPPHAGQHTDDNDAIKAIEAKVGIDGSSVSTTLDYLTKKILNVSPPSGITNPPYALVLDEATTNLVANPSFEIDATNWSAFGLNAALTRVTTQQYVGAAALQLVVSPATAGSGTESAVFAVLASANYILSLWLKGNAGGESIVVGLVGNNSGVTQQTIILTTSWKRYFIAKTTNALDTTLNVRIATSSATAPTWFVDGVQVEQKNGATPTSYCDGSLGLGYAWAGTAHASSSSRTSGLHLLAPFAANIGMPFVIKPDGTMAAWKYVFRSEGGGPSAVPQDYQFDFLGSKDSNVLALGFKEGVLRVSNDKNGCVLWLDGSKVTTDVAMVIDGGGVTTGAILALGSPSDPTAFTGEYFDFTSKSGKRDWRWSKNRQKMGGNNIPLKKYLELYGGGLFAETRTTLAGTIHTAGVNSTTVTGVGTAFTTDYVVGDLIYGNTLAAYRRITAIASATSLTVDAAWNLGASPGQAYSRADTQYEPPVIHLEGRGSKNASGNGDHVYSQFAFHTFALWIAGDDRLKMLKSSAANALTHPAADTDGLYVTCEQDRNASQVLVAGSLAETSVYTVSIPAGRLGTKGGLRCILGGKILKNVVGTLTLRCKYGATTWVVSGAEELTSSATRYAFRWVIELFNAAATNSQKGVMEFHAKVQAAAGATMIILGYGAASVDSTLAQTFDLTVQWSVASASLSFEKQLAYVEAV